MVCLMRELKRTQDIPRFVEGRRRGTWAGESGMSRATALSAAAGNMNAEIGRRFASTGVSRNIRRTS